MNRQPHAIALIGALLILTGCATSRKTITFKQLTPSEFGRECRYVVMGNSINSMWYIGSRNDAHYFVRSRLGYVEERPIAGYVVNGPLLPHQPEYLINGHVAGDGLLRNVFDLKERRSFLYASSGSMEKTAPAFDMEAIRKQALGVKILNAE